MSQHDYTIANQAMAAARSDLNNALKALASLNSGNTAPSTTYATMLWYENDTNKLWIRNEANSGWVHLATFDWGNGQIIWQGTNFQAAVNNGTVGFRNHGGSDLFRVNNSGGVSGSSLASQSEAEGGTVNNKLMTPLSTKQAIDENAGGGITILKTYTSGFTVSHGNDFNITMDVNENILSNYKIIKVIFSISLYGVHTLEAPTSRLLNNVGSFPVAKTVAINTYISSLSAFHSYWLSLSIGKFSGQAQNQLRFKRAIYLPSTYTNSITIWEIYGLN